VDHEGEVLESYVTSTRDKAAAFGFMKKALQRHGRPRRSPPTVCAGRAGELGSLELRRLR
jgi:hypothetical protein